MMILIVSQIFLRKRFSGITLWPFVILRHRKLKNDVVFLNHEKIHLHQQAEMLVIPFYLWYGIEFIIRIFQFKNRHKAYQNISFEREAYANEKDLQYLNKRPFWNFKNYL